MRCGLALVVMLCVTSFAEESAAELQTKLQVNETVKEAALQLLNRHVKADQARKPGGRVKMYRDQINQLLDKMEVASKKNTNNPVARSEDINPLKQTMLEVINDLESELEYKPAKYEHELNLAVENYKRAKGELGKITVLKENAAAVAAADKIVANPKVDAAEIRKAFDVAKK